MKLEILSTEVANNYTTTGITSTVTAATVAEDGAEKTVQAAEGKVLVLVVDGAEEDLVAGKSYEVSDSYKIEEVGVYKVGGPSAAPWIGAAEDEMATYYFRQGLLIDGGEIKDEYSVKDIIVGGKYDANCADGVEIKIDGAHFNGIFADNGTKYVIKNSKIIAKGNGGDDLAGWGAAVMADNKSEIEIADSYIETEGAIRCGIYADNTSIVSVHDSVLYSKEPAGTDEDFQNLTPGMMKRVPFALGMDGAIRTLNVMADGQGKFKDCISVSTGWGTLSTDSGTAYDICGTYALDVENTLGGIGTLEVAKEGKEYTATKEIGGVKYGFTVGGSGYVTYADSGIHNRFRNVEFYSPDYIQVMGSGRSGSSYTDSYLLSGHTTFMNQQSGGGTFELTNTTVDTTDALIQMKSGAANTGFANIICDNCKINFDGKSTRDSYGILAELIESDDAGNPGITEAHLEDHPEDAELTRSSVADCSATFKNGSYSGNIYNSIYNYRQTLNVLFENASYSGTVSSTEARHVDLKGNPVENGRVLYAFMGANGHANYMKHYNELYAKGIDPDAKLIGRFKHTPHETVNNLINVKLVNSKWNVTGSGYINSLEMDAITDICAKEPVTVCVKALTVGGSEYGDGEFVSGNVTIKVDTSVVEIPDNGVVDAGQTYGNVKYQLIAKKEDGSFDSESVTVKRQNYVDGFLYFSLLPAEGYEIVDFKGVGGVIDKNTAGGELAIYDYVLMPDDGVQEMGVDITVK